MVCQIQHGIRYLESDSQAITYLKHGKNNAFAFSEVS